MKTLNAMRKALALFAVLCAMSIQAAVEYVNWDLNVTTGLLNEAGNWEGGAVPAVGTYGNIPRDTGNVQDITIRIPQGGYTDTMGLYFSALDVEGANRTITFDARGTTWEMAGSTYEKSPFTYYNGTSAGTPIFHIENFKTDGSAPVFKWEDVLLRFCSNSKKEEIYLDQGTWDALNGTSDSLNEVMIGYKKCADFHIGTNATFIGNLNLCVPSGDDKVSRAIIEGGENHKIRKLTLLDYSYGCSEDNEAWMIVRGNAKATIQTILAGNKKAPTYNAFGYVVISNNAEVTGSSLTLGAEVKKTGVLQMFNHARYDVGKIQIGSGDNGVGIITVMDHAYLRCENFIINSSSLDVRTSIALGGNARMDVNAIKNTAKEGTTTQSSISLTDTAELSCASIEGNGLTTFTADGGTLTFPSSASTASIGGLTSATINAGGLTINAETDVAVNSSFTGEGVLTLGGFGNVTLNQNADLGGVALSAGAKLVIGEGVTLTAGTLNAMGANATVQFASGAKLALTSTEGIENPIVVLLDGDLAEGDYDVITVGDAQTLDATKFVVVNTTTYRVLTPSVVDGTTLRVNIAPHTGSVNYTWTGTASDNWSDASNWNPSGVPTIDDNVVIEVGADDVSIALNGVANVNSITMKGAADGTAGQVTLTGANPLTVAGVDGISVEDANLTFEVPVALVSQTQNVTVNEGAALTFEGSILSAGGKIEFNKLGLGSLTIAGDNSGLDVDWIIPGGINTFKGAKAFGLDTTSANGLVLSNNTFRYEGAAVTIQRPINFRKAAMYYPAHFDIEGDLTFKELVIGGNPSGYVKTGTGTLKFELAAETTTILRRIPNQDGNPLNWDSSKGSTPTTGVFEPAANGMVTSSAGLEALTILEGRFHIRGQGKDAALVNDGNGASGLVGGAYVAEVSPELYLENINIKLVRNSSWNTDQPFVVAHNMPPEAALPKLTFVNANVIGRVNNYNFKLNAYKTNNVCVFSTLVMTNSTLTGFANGVSDKNLGGTNIVHLTDNSVLSHLNSTDWSRFMNIDFTLETGSQLVYSGNETKGPNRLGIGKDYVRIAIDKESVFQTDRFIITQDCVYDVIFNGGTIQLNGSRTKVYDEAVGAQDINGITCSVTPSKHRVNMTEKGMTVRIIDDVVHTFALPVYGNGVLRKGGAGTCEFSTTITTPEWSNGQNVTTNDAPTLFNAGGLVVEEGVAVLWAGALGNENYPVTVNAGAALSLNGETITLSSLAGAGVVSNGILSATLFAGADGYAAPTFDNVTFRKMVVNMGLSSAVEPPRPGTQVMVARFSGAEKPDLATWEGQDAGDRRKLSFAATDAGEIWATVEDIGGLIIIIR